MESFPRSQGFSGCREHDVLPERGSHVDERCLLDGLPCCCAPGPEDVVGDLLHSHAVFHLFRNPRARPTFDVRFRVKPWQRPRITPGLRAPQKKRRSNEWLQGEVGQLPAATDRPSADPAHSNAWRGPDPDWDGWGAPLTCAKTMGPPSRILIPSLRITSRSAPMAPARSVLLITCRREGHRRYQKHSKTSQTRAWNAAGYIAHHNMAQHNISARHSTAQQCVVHCNTGRYSTQHAAEQYSTVHNNTLQQNVVQFSIVQYNSVQ